MSKLSVCKKALKYVPDSGLIGIGAGSTISIFLDLLKDHDLTVVCANDEIKSKAMKLGFRILDAVPEKLDVSFDGADYFDSRRNLIKGYGKALLREKVIGYNSKKVFILAEQRKAVKSLSGLEVPVEVHPIAIEVVLKSLKKIGAKKVRLIDGLTDNGNNLVHCVFDRMTSPSAIEKKINLIPGVLENGLFTKKNIKVITD